MEIKHQYKNYATESAACRQLADDYEKKGYDIHFDYPIKLGSLKLAIIDLYVEKGDDKIAFEIKMNSPTQSERSQIKEILPWCKKNHVRFKLVIVNSPFDKDIEIDNLEELMFEYIINEGIPSELDELSSLTELEDITELEYSRCHLLVNGEIRVQGNGRIAVTLNYDHDDEMRHHDEYPFKFDVTLEYINHRLNINDLKCKFDTKSFYV